MKANSRSVFVHTVTILSRTCPRRRFAIFLFPTFLLSNRGNGGYGVRESNLNSLFTPSPSLACVAHAAQRAALLNNDAARSVDPDFLTALIKGGLGYQGILVLLQEMEVNQGMDEPPKSFLETKMI